MKNEIKQEKDSLNNIEILEPEIIESQDLSKEEGEYTQEGFDILDIDEEDSIALVQHMPEEEVPKDEELESVSALVPTSGLQRYLSMLRRYPLLTPSEEKKLAIDAYEYNDPTAKTRLVTSNLRLVVKIAMEYRRKYSQILDLIQEGNAGLVKAVERYNPYKGARLSTYSAFWIRANILKFLMDNKSIVRMGTTDAQRKLFFGLQKEAAKLYAQTHKYDTKLLAEKIGVEESDVEKMKVRLMNDHYLDAPIGAEDDTRHIDIVGNDANNADWLAADVYTEKEELLNIIRNEMHGFEESLNERDKFIFKHRIMADDPVTLHDVGVQYGITRERARQLEARIIKNFKAQLELKGIYGYMPKAKEEKNDKQKKKTAKFKIRRKKKD